MGAHEPDDDLHIDEFVQVLRTLEPHLPISDAYERDRPQPRGAWWSSQKEHMTVWFADQDEPRAGNFTRKNPNESARKTYNRLSCTAAFIWLAEALGEDTELVRAAAEAARAEPNARRRPGALRKFFPWSRIARLARDRMS